eukprot:UN22318
MEQCSTPHKSYMSRNLDVFTDIHEKLLFCDPVSPMNIHQNIMPHAPKKPLHYARDLKNIEHRIDFRKMEIVDAPHKTYVSRNIDVFDGICEKLIFSDPVGPSNIHQNMMPNTPVKSLHNPRDLKNVDVHKKLLFYDPVKAFEKQTKTTDAECNFDMDDERLKGNDPALLESIQNEMLVKKLNVTWDSIAGLEQQKRVLRESIIWPIKNPQLFTDDLLNPAKGVLLFGPPGTGKTLLGKAIANEVDATFFSISASSLTSKFFGQSSKLVKALFSLAEYHSPSVIFIDEIDSLLTKRGDKDFEASSRIKTEILIRMEGASTNTDSRVVVIGATNRPEQIDEAARRRLSQKLYIPLPELVSRRALIKHMLSKQKDGCTMSEDDIIEVAEKTEGFSGADLTELCR